MSLAPSISDGYIGLDGCASYGIQMFECSDFALDINRLIAIGHYCRIGIFFYLEP